MPQHLWLPANNYTMDGRTDGWMDGWMDRQKDDG